MFVLVKVTVQFEVHMYLGPTAKSVLVEFHDSEHPYYSISPLLRNSPFLSHFAISQPCHEL